MASHKDGSKLDYGLGSSPHLILVRTEMGTDVNEWFADHVAMLGAPLDNGLQTAFLDFAVDIVGLNVVRPTSPSPDRDKARRPFDKWQERRANGEKTIFTECG